MPLFIRDDDVNALATKLKAATGAKTKTEAVRLALEHELQRIREKLPASQRVAASIATAQTMVPGGGNFDMKAFTDQTWDGISCISTPSRSSRSWERKPTLRIS